jgi:hypothetical protein
MPELMVSATMIWMQIDTGRRAPERRVERRRVERTAVAKKRVEVIQRPVQEAKNVGIMLRCGRWCGRLLLKVFGLKSTRSD